jgi:hypothetical protein
LKPKKKRRSHHEKLNNISKAKVKDNFSKSTGNGLYLSELFGKLQKRCRLIIKKAVTFFYMKERYVDLFFHGLLCQSGHGCY